MTRRQIYLHAGAHRTGTSSLQMCLHDNRTVLTEAGLDLAYPGRDGISSGDLGLRLPAPRHGLDATQRFARKVQEELDRRNPETSRPLVLSEENLPGRMIHFQSGQFYPAAEARFAALRKGFGDGRIANILLVLRNYAQLFVSAHRKRAEDNLVDPFEAAIPKLMQIDRGWPEFVTLMQDILQPERMIVIPYEQRGSSVDLLRELCPEMAELDLVEPRVKTNLSATDAALIALQKRYAAKENLDREAWQAVIKEHAQDTRDLGFAKFAKSEKLELDQRYARDLQVLQTRAGLRWMG